MPRSMSVLDQRDECKLIADEVSKIKDDVETGGIEIRFKWKKLGLRGTHFTGPGVEDERNPASP